MKDSFLNRFPLTQICEGDVPQCLRGSPKKAGVYGSGLLTILDVNLSAVALKSWSWLVGTAAVPIMVTCIGDVFYSDKQGILLLETQRGHSEFIDEDIDWILSEFLVQPDVLRNVLHEPLFEQLEVIHGNLEYSQTYILSPWELLGGSTDVNNYKSGDLEVYLDMVGQFLGKQ